MTVAEVIRELEEIGCRIVKGERPVIHPPHRVDHQKRFERLLEWVVKYRLEILAHYEPPTPRELCPLCRRDVTDEEDKERLRGVNPFCSWGGVPSGWNRLTEKPIPAKPGCPYRTE